jgi:hypothetical protein
MIKKIIILFSLIFFLFGERKEFIISYRIVVQNNQILNEKFNVTLAMNQTNFKIGQKIAEVDCKKFQKLKKCLIDNQDKITQELFKLGVLLNDTQTKKTFNINAKTVLVLPPISVVVNVKEDFATIYLKN